MRVVMKNRRRNEADSWKNIIPRMTVHTAPMPVHIGYAVPIGMVFTALASSTMLIVRHNMKPVPQSHHAVPETSFIFPRQNAKPDSNSRDFMPGLHSLEDAIMKMLFISVKERRGDVMVGVII